MLNNSKKEQKSLPKVQNFKFTILLITLVETLPRSIHEFGGANLGFLSEEMSFETFTPILLAKTKKNGKILQFFEQLL